MGQKKVLRTAEWRRQQIQKEFEQRIKEDLENKKKEKEQNVGR